MAHPQVLLRDLLGPYRMTCEAVVKKNKSDLRETKARVAQFLNSVPEREIKTDIRQNPSIPDVDFIRICDDGNEQGTGTVDWAINACVFEENESSLETMDGGDADDPQVASSQNWFLPCRSFDGVWESLFFEDETKSRLYRYAITCVLLGKSDIDPNIILCNRLILLHGPPGTGKTTICRALAQKLSLRMQDVFSSCQLVEINCHSLFSKWFSESGKLVSKMFQTIRQYAENSASLVVVLIDEVESLTAARQGALSGSEPSDAIRVVNAVLTQLDSFRFMPNVLVMATSNLTEAIDAAFLDRADIIQFIGLPGPVERKLILKSCLEELTRSKLISCANHDMIDWPTLVEECKGLSGRALRKLPLIALAEASPHLDRDIGAGLITAARTLVQGKTAMK